MNEGLPFDVEMARDLGLTPRNLQDLFGQGHLRRVIRGIYIDSRAPGTREIRLMAIQLVAPPEAIVCNESASWLMGVDAYKPSEQHLLKPFLVVPHGTTRVTKPGVRCRQAKMSARDIIEVGGVLITNPLRTASDLLRRLYRPYALAAADGLAHAGLVDPEDLWEFVAKLKGYPGIVQGRALALLVEPLAQSPGESWQRLRMIDAGFPIPKAQILVVDAYGRERWLDMGYEHLQIAAEYDGREFHTDDADNEHDDDRRGYLRKVLGWHISVTRKENIFGEDMSFEDELGRLLRIGPRPRSWGTKVSRER